MSRRVLVSLMLLIVAAALVPAKESPAALMLRGQFPLREGMYWNFATGPEKEPISWVAMGAITQSDIGPLHMLVQQGHGFVALQERWDGLYAWARYHQDGFEVADRPWLFMPYVIDFDTPMTTTSTVSWYTTGDSPKKTGQDTRTVTVALKSLEDRRFEGRELRNCAVLEKTTVFRGKTTRETIRLAPSVGPIEIETSEDGTTQVCTLQSYCTPRGPAPQRYDLSDYFPLQPGTTRVYRDRSGQEHALAIGRGTEMLGRATVPFTEPHGDTFYLEMNERGLTFPVKYNAAMRSGFVTLPPDVPPVILPATLTTGRLNRDISYFRSSGWPSIRPNMDFYPEQQICSVLLGTQDVSTPAGTYRDCLKICLVNVSRSFNVQRERARAGFLWLANGVGEVKRDSLCLANAYLEESPDFVYRIQQWDLARVETGTPAGVEPTAAAPEDTAPPEDEPLGAPEDLRWEGASRAMFDAAVAAAPFFVRPRVGKNLLRAIARQSGPDGSVGEETVLEAVREVTPPGMQKKLLRDLEKLRTR